MTEPIDWRAHSASFDRVAELYDQYRPGYPAELVESIIAQSEIPRAGKILEIGCGTGKATALFATRGYSILCVEPGKNLVAIAERNLRGWRVEFETTAFENWNARVDEFDLVISAQAFHWVAPTIGFPKIARALKHNGWLALFWNLYPELDSEITRELDQVYRACAPELAREPDKTEETIREREIALRASGCFDAIEIKRFPWSARYSTDQYIGLLNTYSDHLMLADESRARLFDVVAQSINNQGGFIDRPYLAVLYLARKAIANSNK